MKVRMRGDRLERRARVTQEFPYEEGQRNDSFKKHFKIRRVMACLHVDGNTSVEERLMKKKLMKNV